MGPEGRRSPRPGWSSEVGRVVLVKPWGGFLRSGGGSPFTPLTPLTPPPPWRVPPIEPPASADRTRSAQSGMPSATGNAEGMTFAFTSSGRLRSPPVWPTLKTRSGRECPIMAWNQRIMVPKRWPKPFRNPRWTKNQTTQPGKPLRRIPCTLHDGLEAADARRAAEVTVRERDRVLAGEPPLDRVGGVQPALHRHLADAGELVDRRHVADGEDLGVPGQAEVRPHRDPAGAVVSAPVAWASMAARGDACTPAAQTTVPHSKRVFSPAALCASTPNGSTPTTRSPMRSSTPIFSRSAQAAPESRSPKLVSGSEPPSTSTTRTEVGSMVRKFTAEAPRRQLADLPGELDAGRPRPDHDEGGPEPLGASAPSIVSASSRRRRRVRRSSMASSIVFMPGATRANSSCPK